MRIKSNEMYNQFLKILLKFGFSLEKAKLSAKLFTESSLDGYYSHGLNRFPQYISSITNGYMKVNNEPKNINSIGVLEQWDGQLGPGNINAYKSMERSIDMAKKNGIGCVALRNTNHWMRGGSYGWQAVESDCIGICWTNTIPNMPPWGSIESKLGNNPIIFAIPNTNKHIVLDIAVSQFSYGQLSNFSNENKILPVDGGYNNNGQLTKKSTEILDSKRPLPIGFWKGSGLSLVLDLIAMILSGGNSSYDIGNLNHEYAVSQVFITFDLKRLPENNLIHEKIKKTIDNLHMSLPVDKNKKVLYPGEGTLLRRKENSEKGIPVDHKIWADILKM
ncbi:MAG: 3-dehydro-L-gulonate 2-dehydrogenase [Clostridiales bacterium]